MEKTALYEEHKKAGAKLIEFGGWMMPVFYTNVIDEHLATRNFAGLFDISHMGEIFIQGPDAFNLIQKVITNDLNKLEKGRAFYANMCNENGGVVDDLFVYCFEDDNYMLVVNASTTEKDRLWLEKWSMGFDVTITDKTKDFAKLDIQGPKSEEILQKLTSFQLASLKRFHFIEDEVDGIKTIISRTGYTAEDGFELYFSTEYAVKLWNSLLNAGEEFGIKHIGLGARDTLRLEACYSLYGHELSDEISPIEAGISFVVKKDKEDFIAKDILVKQMEEGPKRKIIAIELEKGIPRHGYAIKKEEGEIGKITSGTLSPTLKKGIGLGLVKSDSVKVGESVDIDIRGKLYKGDVIKKPFYKFHGKSEGV